MFGLNKMRVGTKIGLGFGLITLTLMGVVLITIQQVKNMESITKRVVELRTPTAHSSLMMLNGMNHSLAALRGWVILGDAKFKEERHRAWEEQIEPSLEKMQSLSSQWTETENIGRLKIITEELARFKQSQQEIENIAQTEENTPARKILFDQVDPLEEALITYITRMINLEMRIPPSPKRKALLGIMADLEGTASQALEKAEEFLLSGKEVFKIHFEDMWATNSKRYEDLKEHSDLLSDEQLKVFKRLSKTRKKLEPLIFDIVKIRGGDNWNMANAWLGTKAVPSASKIKALLNTMTENQNDLLNKDVEDISNRTHYLITLLVLLFFTSALISGVLGSSITRGISEPIQKVNHLAREMASGNLKQKKLSVTSQDELGDLTESFNQLLERMKNK